MSYRTDKFAVGDRVEWDRDFKHYDPLFATHIPLDVFTIKEVIEKPEREWEGIAHTQHVIILECDPKKNIFSGAWFKKVAE